MMLALCLCAIVLSCVSGVLCWLWLSSQDKVRDLHEQIGLLRSAAAPQHGPRLAWVSRTERAPLARASPTSPPPRQRVIYNLVTIGVPGSGKTELTLRWADPTVPPGATHPTTKERYQCTVSYRWDAHQGAYVEHVFEFLDYGGEFRNDAQSELLLNSRAQAVLLVVDLARYDALRGAQIVDPARIQAQIDSFNTYVLNLFFSREVSAHCKTFVLFINKADLLVGTAEQVEAQAREHYAPLVRALERHNGKDGVRVQILVGSARGGHGTKELERFLLDRLLPAEHDDEQVLTKLTGSGDP